MVSLTQNIGSIITPDSLKEPKRLKVWQKLSRVKDLQTCLEAKFILILKKCLFVDNLQEA